ncbi:TPA: radical SAM protein [Bacillus pseudomycoides]|nr:radical SAM protein [Bacillus pseudomycoides]
MKLHEKIICDVLYVHTSKSLQNPDYGVIPVGIFPMLQLLQREGYKIVAVNLAVELAINPEFNIDLYLSNCEYRVLLTDLHWYEHSYGVIELAKISKNRNPESKVIIGGITSSIFAKEILQNFNCIDYIIKGDGEQAIVTLVNYVFDGMVSQSTIPNLYYKDQFDNIQYTFDKVTVNLDELDYVNAIELLQNWPTYLKFNVTGVDWFKPIRSFWLGTARGCPFTCSYCGGSKDTHSKVFNSKKLRIRDLGVVSEEVKILREKYGVYQIKPTHDIALFYRSYWERFIDILRDNNVGIYNEFWQLPKIEFIEHFITNVNLKISRLALTVISGDETVRKSHGKNFNNEEFFNVLQKIAEKRVALDVYFSPNLPGETKDIFLNSTVPFIKRIRDINPVANIYLQPITLEPNSVLSREISDIKLKTFQDYYNYCKQENRTEHLGFPDHMDGEFLKYILDTHLDNQRKESINFHYDYTRL